MMHVAQFIKIGFLDITVWDILDILIVGYMLYQIYKLLRGTIAFNIFIGVLALYAVWWLVRALNMDLLSSILDQFVSVGVIILLIIFQPEVRRFLLFIGNTTLRSRAGFLRRLFSKKVNGEAQTDFYVEQMLRALQRMSRSKTGALIVFGSNTNVQNFKDSGVILDAEISTALLEAIFHKESPLHDGAVIVADNRIHAAGCVLPLSDREDLPKSAGLRHRAGVGVTEGSTVAALILSEETGKTSYAVGGNLFRHVNEEQVREFLGERFKLFLEG